MRPSICRLHSVSGEEAASVQGPPSSQGIYIFGV